MKKFILCLAAALLTFGAGATVPHRSSIPNIPGYMTLKGDFHIHTNFTDVDTPLLVSYHFIVPEKYRK